MTCKVFRQLKEVYNSPISRDRGEGGAGWGGGGGMGALLCTVKKCKLQQQHC